MDNFSGASLEWLYRSSIPFYFQEHYISVPVSYYAVHVLDKQRIRKVFFCEVVPVAVVFVSVSTFTRFL